MRCFSLLPALTVMLLCTVVSEANASKRLALLVGVDAYPSLKALGSDDIGLRGVTKDLDHMSKLLEVLGFERPIILSHISHQEPTGVAIREGLQNTLGAASSGDVVLFYFTGRGSVTTSGEPSLVPRNGEATSASSDVPMSILESWAKEVTDKGATPVVILDTSFTEPPTVRGFMDRSYRSTPKYARQGSLFKAEAVRESVYEGPGIFLSACEARGNAYEWRRDVGNDDWMSGFTDILTDAAMGYVRADCTLSVLNLLSEVKEYFSGKTPSYMMGMRPECRIGDTVPGGDRFALRTSSSGKDRPSGVSEAFSAHEEFLGNNSLRLLVRPGGGVADGPDAERWRALAASTQQRLKSLVPEMVGTSETDADPDVTLEISGAIERPAIDLKFATGNLSWDDATNYSAEAGGSLPDMLVLALRKVALAKRLFYLVGQSEQTLKQDWTVNANKPTYPARTADVCYRFDVTAPCDGTIYLLNKDEKDGIVQIQYPYQWRRESDNRLMKGGPVIRAGTHEVPGPDEAAIELSTSTPVGHSICRALFLAAPASPLPPLKMDADYPEFLASLVDHLDKLVELVSSRQAQWSWRDAGYEVVNPTSEKAKNE